MKQWQETREVLEFLARARGAGQRAALATVVRVRGSVSRHEGAKLAVAADGSTAGNVSGGCLGQDVRGVGWRVLRAGAPELGSYCWGADEIEAWDLGVGCEGQVDLWVEPADEPRARERELLQGRTPFAVCTLLPEPGERPGRAGAARLIVTPAATEGDLGATALNRAAARRARAAPGAPEAGAPRAPPLAARPGVLCWFDAAPPPPP